ncbi:hypothetical protein BGZ57DRAFT_985595 [Hyaloscypha finlandica]|nr:hypothetical protein BGZ57DRAFT_985595 [Hyaloscypha finlandica]
MASSTGMDDIGPSVVLCNAIMISLTTFCIGIRFCTRFFITKVYGWDDLCLGVGYLFAMVLCVCCIIETRYGLGRHVSTVSPEDLGTLLKYNFAAELAYIFSFVASKLAFVFIYLRIFPKSRLRTSSYVLAAILVAELIEESAVVLAQCAPLQKAWNVELPGKCLNLLTFFYVSFGIKLGTDIALFCLPIPMLGTLKIDLGKKIGVIFMFSLGLLVCIISIVRATFLQNTSTDITCEKPLSSPAPDPGVTANATAYPPGSYFASRTKLVDNRTPIDSNLAIEGPKSTLLHTARVTLQWLDLPTMNARQKFFKKMARMESRSQRTCASTIAMGTEAQSLLLSLTVMFEMKSLGFRPVDPTCVTDIYMEEFVIIAFA